MFPLLIVAVALIIASPCSAARAQEASPAPKASPAQSNPDADPKPHITILENTLIRVVTDQPLSARHSKEGTPVSFTVNEDVFVNRMLLIPRGAKVHGEVIQARTAGVVSGASELKLELTSLELGGETYPLYTYQIAVHGASKTKPPADLVAGAATMGALTGSVIANSSRSGTTAAKVAADMTAGAAAGAGVVGAAALLTPAPPLNLPAEYQMDFYLASPISVRPVSAKEAEKLAQRLRPGGPVLYIRGDAP